MSSPSCQAVASTQCQTSTATPFAVYTAFGFIPNSSNRHSNWHQSSFLVYIGSGFVSILTPDDMTGINVSKIYFSIVVHFLKQPSFLRLYQTLSSLHQYWLALIPVYISNFSFRLSKGKPNTNLHQAVSPLSFKQSLNRQHGHQRVYLGVGGVCNSYGHYNWNYTTLQWPSKVSKGKSKFPYHLLK